MRVLFFGDVVGKSGREALCQAVGTLRQRYGADIVVANVENAVHGKGIRADIAHRIHDAGVDLMTLGNHIWDHRGFEAAVDGLDFLCVPLNLLPKSPGHRFRSIRCKGKTLGVLSLLGQGITTFPVLPAFSHIDGLAEEYRSECDILILDFHAEKTAEKIAMGWLLDGRLDAVVGTHTHVQTNDARRLPGGTLYMTDLGMCGGMNSIIGASIETALPVWTTGMPRSRENDDGHPVRLSGCLLDFCKWEIEPINEVMTR